MTWLRSAAFNLAFYGLTAAFAVLCLPALLLPAPVHRRCVVAWARAVIWLLRVVCDIRLRIEGEDALPRRGPALVAAKHQSAFDTLVWLPLLPDAVYVLKRELLAIPIWGWHARRLGMIAVDRQAGAAAMRHLIRAGRAAATAGRQIVIFPEGTRVAPGAHRPYQPGVVALATATGLPVLPVATDSGRRWGRHSFLKRPGTITISILPAIPAATPREELLERLEAAVEGETARLLAG
ncbi:MAG TPA: lysophospholipid acyltransferase family protein [Crenalkalicoccus sp.]|nr:lysophospholipid acyltransferase family protein [Crenalkalicoccus sp.]